MYLCNMSLTIVNFLLTRDHRIFQVGKNLQQPQVQLLTNHHLVNQTITHSAFPSACFLFISQQFTLLEFGFASFSDIFSFFSVSFISSKRVYYLINLKIPVF